MDNKIPNMDYDADEVINEFKEKIKWPKSDEVTAVVKPSKMPLRVRLAAEWTEEFLLNRKAELSTLTEMTEEAADALLLQKHLLMLTERRRLTELTFQSSVKFRLIRITTDNQS